MSKTKRRVGKDELESVGRGGPSDASDLIRRRMELRWAAEQEELVHELDDVELHCRAVVLLPETYEQLEVEVTTSSIDPMQVARELVAEEHGCEAWQVIPVMLENLVANN